MTCRRIAHLLHATVEVRRNADGKLLLLTTRRVSAESSRVDEMIELLDLFAGECVERLLSSDLAGPEPEDPGLGSESTFQGVHELFSRLPAGRQPSAGTPKIETDSAIFAWRAYLSALFLKDLPKDRHPAIRDQAVDYCRRALDSDPNDGLSLALVTHVHAFVLRDFAKAHEFLHRALVVRSDHVMTQDAASLLRQHMDDLKSARAAAFRSERLGAFLPYRYCYAVTQCMLETMAGNFEAGVRHGEWARALLPDVSARPYPPSLRYLGVCYAQIGQVERAERIFRQLAEMEGDPASTEIASRLYPIPSESAADLMRQSLRLLGK